MTLHYNEKRLRTAARTAAPRHDTRYLQCVVTPYITLQITGTATRASSTQALRLRWRSRTKLYHTLLKVRPLNIELVSRVFVCVPGPSGYRTISCALPLQLCCQFGEQVPAFTVLPVRSTLPSTYPVLRQCRRLFPSTRRNIRIQPRRRRWRPFIHPIIAGTKARPCRSPKFHPKHGHRLHRTTSDSTGRLAHSTSCVVTRYALNQWRSGAPHPFVSHRSLLGFIEATLDCGSLTRGHRWPRPSCDLRVRVRLRVFDAQRMAKPYDPTSSKTDQPLSSCDSNGLTSVVHADPSPGQPDKPSPDVTAQLTDEAALAVLRALVGTGNQTQ